MKKRIRDMQKWQTFTAVFEKYSGKNDDIETVTVLLLDVRNTRNESIRDHMWFECRGSFATVELRKGDTVEFVSRAEYQSKGYRGRIGKHKDTRCYEFKLEQPVKVRKLSGA